MILLELAGGFVLLVAGGDALVRGAVALAARLGVSPLMIGLTLVGFGTSMPELVTSLQAAFDGAPGIAVGNVVGSNIANILLILGTAALIYPVATSRAAFGRDGTSLMLATLACTGAVLLGHLDRLTGLVLMLLLAGYLAVAYFGERRAMRSAAAQSASVSGVQDTIPAAPGRLWLALLMVIGGIGLTVLGARFLVSGAISLAAAAGISETVVGLTVVAVGTSLPELVTSVMAALRRQSDVAFGNIIGSNIFNVLGILGVTAAVHPIEVPAEIAAVDIWVMLGVTLIFTLFAVTGWRICRKEGAVLLAGYGIYTGLLLMDSGLFAG